MVLSFTLAEKDAPTAESRSPSVWRRRRRRMLKPMILLALLTVITLPAAAQKVEIFGGYQFSHLGGRFNGDINQFDDNFNGSGWNFAVAGNLKHVLGFAADFSGTYKNDLKTHTYTVGPVLTARLPVVQPFVHALFGGITLSEHESHTGFAMYLGGGFDIGLRKGIGFRIVQVDWLSTRFSGNTNNSNGRVSTGIVVKF
jgi:hypothetical protein